MRVSGLLLLVIPVWRLLKTQLGRRGRRRIGAEVLKRVGERRSRWRKRRRMKKSQRRGYSFTAAIRLHSSRLFHETLNGLFSVYNNCRGKYRPVEHIRKKPNMSYQSKHPTGLGHETKKVWHPSRAWSPCTTLRIHSFAIFLKIFLCELRGPA